MAHAPDVRTRPRYGPAKAPNGALGLAHCAAVDGIDLDTHRRRRSLDRRPLGDARARRRVEDDANPGDARRHLLEQFQPLCADRRFEQQPVALPPGRARLLTNPAPTGSGTIANTIATARVACSNGATAALPL